MSNSLPKKNILDFIDGAVTAIVLLTMVMVIAMLVGMAKESKDLEHEQFRKVQETSVNKNTLGEACLKDELALLTKDHNDKYSFVRAVYDNKTICMITIEAVP